MKRVPSSHQERTPPDAARLATREEGYAPRDGEAVIDDHNAKAIELPIYYVPPDWSRRAYIDAAGYEAKYRALVTKPQAFGRRRASASTGFKPYTRTKNTNFRPGHVSICWFEDDTTNIAYNCIERHCATRGDQVAIICKSDDPAESTKITYRWLRDEVCRMANVMRERGGGSLHTLRHHWK